jgi:hypothetical protein
MTSSSKAQRPPEGEPWVWETRALLQSAPWQAQSINCRRLIEFLQLEHMRHGGTANGKLKAPRRQLSAFGIGEHFISDAIHEGETLGLIDVCRGRRRLASTYTLTWLPLHDGTPASNRWRGCDAKAAEIGAARRLAKIRNHGSGLGAKKQSKEHFDLSAKEHSNVDAKCHSKATVMNAKQHSKPTETCSGKQHSLIINSCQGGDVLEVEGMGGIPEAEALAVVHDPQLPPGKPDRLAEENEPPPVLDPSAKCSWYVTVPVGFRICGVPALLGTERCPAHERLHALRAAASGR